MALHSVKQKTPAGEPDEKYRIIVENATDGILIVQDDAILFANPAALKLTGRTAVELEKSPFADLVHPDERGMLLGLNERVLSGEQPAATCSFRLSNTAGREVWAQINSVRIGWKSRQATLNFIRDVTSVKLLEEQFRQAQKMEAVGTLAGGVAHDFNNLLTTIIGNAELAREDLPEGAPLLDEIDEIRTAGKRAAELTRELLAFSRKQMIHPVALDINEQARGAEKLLRRVIGEKIRLETALAPEPHTVWMDPGQLDHVVMNLAVNAKEAMPDGGTLIIETANVDLDPEYFRMRGVAESPGPYVLLAISDTGIGMDKETLSHIFEPFFSLKGKTRGTGLGLSTVYGIVKQNKGYIWFYSEPGKGSTCRIYLPALRGDIPDEPPREKTLHGYSGTETVLVAEDDDHLRHFVCKVLRQRGYFVLEAETGEAALKASAAHDGSIDILLSDVVMPGIDGRELAQSVLRQRPGTRVLFMSGYTERAISQLKALGPDTNFLPKPFTPETLCRMIRKLLD